MSWRVGEAGVLEMEYWEAEREEQGLSRLVNGGAR